MFSALDRERRVYVGLLITVADVLVALWLANSSAQSAAKTAALEQTGVLALAQIMGLTQTGREAL